MGRPKLDVAERLRRRIWYANVMRLSGLTNFKLSCIFDLNLNSNSDRRPIFERLETDDEMPYRGRTGEFVRLVNDYRPLPALNGTAEIYLSPFWELMGKDSLSIDRLREITLQCARATGLLKQPGNYDDDQQIFDALLSLPPTEVFEFLRDKVNQYSETLNLIIEHLASDLNVLCLFGCVYRESLQAGHLEIAQLLEGKFGNLLEDVTASELVPESLKGDLFTLAITRVRVSTPVSEYAGERYISLLQEGENAHSLLAMFLARHDRVIWDI